MNNAWLQRWLLSLIRSSNSHVMQAKVWTVSYFIPQCQRCTPSSGDLMWFYSKLLQCQTYFYIKSCLSHTFPRAVQSVTQTERVHLSLPIYALLFSPRLSPSCNAGMVDSCLLIQCHGLFPLSVCFDVSIQSGSVGESASVSGPLLTSGHRHHKEAALF